MQKRRVILTAGHNGPGTGASALGFDEGTETIKLRDLITANLKALGIDVTNDTNIEKTAGVIAWIKRLFTPNDLLIEIHFNASLNRNATGTEAFTQVNPTGLEKSIASNLAKVTEQVLEIPNRGAKVPSQSQHNTIGILDNTQVHAVLWEVCFLTNANDLNQYRLKANALAISISNLIALSI